MTDSPTAGYSSIVRVGPRAVLITYNRGPNNGAAAHRGAFAVNQTCQVAAVGDKVNK